VVLVVLGLALAAASAGHGWRTFFHTTGGFHWRIPLFFTGMLAAGALLTHITRRGLGSWAHHTLLVCAVALPSGVYYYQFDQNLLRGFGLAVLAAAIVGRMRPAAADDVRLSWSALAWLAPLALLMPQRAGGWEWELAFIHWVEQLPIWAPGAIVAALLALLVLRAGDGRARLLLGLLVGATVGYSMWFGGLEASRLAGATLVLLFVAEWTRWRRTRVGAADPEAEGLVLAATGMLVLLVQLGGFQISKIDFHFGFAVAGGLRTERAQLIAIGLLTLLKYALPVWTLIAAHALAAGRAGLERIHAAALFFLSLRLLALASQALVTGLELRGQYSELAVAEALFLSLLALAWSCGYVLLAHFPRHWARRFALTSIPRQAPQG
jgi:hypothetical protein